MEMDTVPFDFYRKEREIVGMAKVGMTWAILFPYSSRLAQ